MSHWSIPDHITTSYSIVDSIDLATINQSTSAVYKVLEKLYQAEYGPNQRIIFYSQYRPSQDLANHIQKAAKVVDISNCFIVICCGHPVQDIFDTSHQLFGDPSEDAIRCCIEDVQSDQLLPDDFLIDDSKLCSLPWSHLSLDNVGNYAACCVYRGSLGSVINSSINDVFHGDQMNELRRKFSQGELVHECRHCWDLEDNGLTSNRINHIKFHRRKLMSQWIDYPRVRSVDIKGGNICNFSCRICSPQDSSKIAAERLKHSTGEDRVKMTEFIKKGQWFDGDQNFLIQMKNLLPDLINIEFYGGEPLLQKNLHAFLKSAVESNDCSHIRLHTNTNGSIDPERIMPLLKKFQHVDIAVSIDDIGERFELQRGGSWSKIEKNICQMKSWANEQLRVYLMPTINVQNVLYLDSLFEWAQKKNIDVTVNYLDNPWYLCIDYMTDRAKQLVIDRYQNHSIKELANLAKRVANSPGSNGSEFVKYTKRLDSIRSQDFSLAHQEIATAMGYFV